ncbi:MAG: hypothetical protein IH620_00855 [Ignavibacterium sp.]|nr:hypothetical protein [Ignavibacterium sp.]
MGKETTNYTPSYLNACRKIAVQNIRNIAVKRYDESILQINKLRDIGNDFGKKISANKHRALISLAKSELGKKLIGATRIEKSKPY